MFPTRLTRDLISPLHLLVSAQPHTAATMVGGTGQKLTEATVILAGAASLAATLMSIVYVLRR